MSYAAASGHPLTTAAAEQILADGGTAVDACLAAAFTAFVAEPVLAQPLGGGFLMVAGPDGRTRCLDMFVQTPRSKAGDGELDLKTITVDFGNATQDFHIGAGTVATPCLMQGLFAAHDDLGRVPRRELAAIAVRHARDGVRVTALQAHISDLVAPILLDAPEIAALYGSNGKTLAEATEFRNPDLADSLEVGAIEGPRLFSQGEVGQALVGLPGGHLTMDDLHRAQPRWRQPLAVGRAGATISLNPPPSLGGVQIALALETLPRAPRPDIVAAALAAIVRIRAETGVDERPAEAASLLLDPARVAEVERILSSHQVATRGTTHISAVDRNGLGVALTLSNGEGCGRLLPGTGIHPNNMLGEEDLVAGGPTAWRSDTRLASMMCPMAIRDGEGTLTLLGSGGSNRIRSALTTTTLELLDNGLGLAEAIAAPRMHVESGSLDFEDTGTSERREALLSDWPEARAWDRPSMYFGGVHAVRRTRSGEVAAAGDDRRAGVAVTG